MSGKQGRSLQRSPEFQRKHTLNLANTENAIRRKSKLIAGYESEFRGHPRSHQGPVARNRNRESLLGKEKELPRVRAGEPRNKPMTTKPGEGRGEAVSMPCSLPKTRSLVLCLKTSGLFLPAD